MERRLQPLDAGLWALVCCPIVAWAGAYWSSESDVFGTGSRAASLGFLTFFIVVPALLAAVGNAALGQRGRPIAHASFWAVMVTLLLIIPIAVIGLLIDFPFS